MRVAVVGGGVSGLVASYVAAEGGLEVVLYEKEDYLGGHAKTVAVDGTSLDLGFMVFNRVSNFFLFSFALIISASTLLIRFLHFNPFIQHFLTICQSI